VIRIDPTGIVLQDDAMQLCKGMNAILPWLGKRRHRILRFQY